MFTTSTAVLNTDHGIKILHELPHELSNNLRLWILGNQEALGKDENKVEIELNAQSWLHKYNFFQEQ